MVICRCLIDMYIYTLIVWRDSATFVCQYTVLPLAIEAINSTSHVPVSLVQHEHFVYRQVIRCVCNSVNESAPRFEIMCCQWYTYVIYIHIVACNKDQIEIVYIRYT
jgi:hypothetical protein